MATSRAAQIPAASHSSIWGIWRPFRVSWSANSSLHECFLVVCITNRKYLRGTELSDFYNKWFLWKSSITSVKLSLNFISKKWKSDLKRNTHLQYREDKRLTRADAKNALYCHRAKHCAGHCRDLITVQLRCLIPVIKGYLITVQ